MRKAVFWSWVSPRDCSAYPESDCPAGDPVRVSGSTVARRGGDRSGRRGGSGGANQAQVVVQVHHVGLGVFIVIEGTVGEVRLEFAGVGGEALEGLAQALQRGLLAGRLGQRGGAGNGFGQRM